MSSFVELGVNNNNNVGIAQALSTAIIRPLFTPTSRTNWSISYFPGPLTSSTTTATILPNDKYYPFWALILIAIFGSITSVLTVLGNILVILSFLLDRQIRQPTNYFILSLSVSDFLIGLLSMPLLTIYIYAKEWPLNGTICDIWLSLDYTVCLTSIYTVLFITIDRFCSVKMPAKYRKWRTIRKINMMIAISWAGRMFNE
jgi:muscarinic acetylcholine receptor